MKAAYTTLAALAVNVLAAPTFSNTPAPVDTGLATFSDIDILQFGLYLENFQNAFYREGLANFTQADFAKSGFDVDFYTNLTEIASEQATHVTSWSATLDYLNASQVSECSYYFNVTSPLSFVLTASLVQGVAVSSYLSAVSMLQDPSLRTVVSSVLAVEARQSSFVRAALGQQPFASPFDTPITLNEAYELAELYTPSCPKSNPDLGLKTFSILSSSFSNHGVVGGEVTFLTFGNDVKPAAGSDQIFAAFLTVTGPIFAPATPVPGLGFNVTVPTSLKGYAPINGFTYVVLTSNNDTLTDNDVLAGPATIEIYAK